MTTAATPLEQSAAALAGYQNDPLGFIGQLWPHCKFWKKQRETAESLARNFGTLVHSGIETGKGYVAARLILWFYATRFPCKVVATSITFPQLKDSLWGEIGSALRTTVDVGGVEVPVREVLGIDVKHMELRRIDQATKRPYEDDWVRLRVAREVEGMAGIHLPPLPDGGPTVLIVCDETSGVSDEFCTSLEGQAHRMLVQGNPLNTAGYFARKIRKGNEPDPLDPDRYRWYVIHIDCARTPNVSAGRKWDRLGRKGPMPVPVPGIMSYPSFLSHMQDWDEYNRTTRLRGLLPDSDEGWVVVPRTWIGCCRTLCQEIDRLRGELPKWLGVDASHGRGDLACWAVVDRLGLVDLRTMAPDAAKDKYGQPDTVKMLELTRDLMTIYEIPPGRVAVDAGGGGQEAIADPLRREGMVVRLVDFGSSPSNRRAKKQYRNRRAELYGTLAEAMNPAKWRRIEGEIIELQDRGGGVWETCFSIPQGDEYDALAEELPMVPKLYDPEGKMYLPRKHKRDSTSNEQSLEEILGHSPDRSDALVLAVWAMLGTSLGAPSVSRPLVLTAETVGQHEVKSAGRSVLIERVFGREGPDERSALPWEREGFWGDR